MDVNTLDRFSLMRSGSERVASLLDCEEMSDVTFLVSHEGQLLRYPAHKFLLSLASPVFRTMFTSSLAEGKADAKAEITDVSPTAFENVLRYVYTDRPNLDSVRTALDTLYAAHKYMLYHLVSLCTDFLAKHVNCENVLEILSEVALYDLELYKGNVVLKSLRVLDRDAIRVLKSPSFGNVDFSTLKTILRREFLHVSSESQVFEAVVYWALQECRRRKIELNVQNKREVLGKALHLVQYLAMSREEFLEGPAESGLLTEAECRGLLAKIYGDEEVDLPVHLRKQCLQWKRVPYECYPVKFYRKEPDTITSAKQEQSVIIATNRDVMLLGFDLYGAEDVVDGYYVNGLHLTVTDLSGLLVGRVQWKVGQRIPVKENNKLYVEFLEAVFVKARKKYKIHLCLPKGKYLLGNNWEGTTTSKYKCRSIDFAVKYCSQTIHKEGTVKPGDASDDESFAELDDDTDEETALPPSTPSLPPTEANVNGVAPPVRPDPEEAFVRSHFQGVKFYF